MPLEMNDPYYGNKIYHDQRRNKTSLQMNDPHYGDKAYYDKRRMMLKFLDDTYNRAYIDSPSDYLLNHEAVQKNVSIIADEFPEQFSDLMDQNTRAYETRLNQLDFMDGSKEARNDPVARLGSQGANTALRIPPAWADAPPQRRTGVGAYSKLGGFYNRGDLPDGSPIDTLVIPMATALNAYPGVNPRNITQHEVSHRGFSKLGNPVNNNAEHNYVYKKTNEAFPGSAELTPDQVDTIYPVSNTEGYKNDDFLSRALYNTENNMTIQLKALDALKANAKPPSNFIPPQSLGSTD